MQSIVTIVETTCFSDLLECKVLIKFRVVQAAGFDRRRRLSLCPSMREIAEQIRQHRDALDWNLSAADRGKGDNRGGRNAAFDGLQYPLKTQDFSNCNREVMQRKKRGHFIGSMNTLKSPRYSPRPGRLLIASIPADPPSRDRYHDTRSRSGALTSFTMPPSAVLDDEYLRLFTANIAHPSWSLADRVQLALFPIILVVELVIAAIVKF